MGATFVQAAAAQQQVSADGYAQKLTEDQEAATQRMYAEESAKADIVITTALVRGWAPTTITAEMVAKMKPGSVIVDLAAAQGGNCPLTEPGRTVEKHGVTLVGETNLPALVAADASALYARNVLDFLKLLFTQEGAFQVPMDDDIVAACLMTQGGEVKRKSA
jgi:NAD(P) transhydrogenase subunit alpha